MRKLLIVLMLLFCGVGYGFGQLAGWDLTTNGNPTQTATNVVAGNFTGSTGISAVTYSTSGASASSWSTGVLDPTNYFEVFVAPATGYKLTIQALNFSERRSLTGIHTYEVQYSTDAAFTSPVTLTTFTVPDDDLERVGDITGLNIIVNNGDTIYFRWYGYAAEGTAGTWRINDATLKVIGIVSQININNNDSYIQDPATQVSAGNISSLITSSTISVPVFKSSVTDSGSGDGLPTKITQITLKNSLSGAGADWQNTIQGIVLKNNGNPVNIQQTDILPNSIVLTLVSGDLTILDASSSELTFEVYLNTSNIADDSQIQFFIDHLNPGWDTDFSGSAFSPSFTSDIVSNVFTIDVQASKLQFISFPSSVWATQNFSVAVEATDIYNNLDLSAANQITIQQSVGNGILNSNTGLSVQLVAGMYNWSDLTYDTPENFSLIVSDNLAILSSATTNLISCLAAGQVLNETFADGDFLNNPAWNGDISDFIISANQLELSAAITTDTSFLATPMLLIQDSIEWQVLVKLNFPPSSNNYIKYYVCSNNENFKDTLHGYFIRVGEDGANDAIELFYQNGSTVTSICRGTDGSMATNPYVRIKVIRNNVGLWRIYADMTGGSNFVLQATATENSFFNNGFYTGMSCCYTSSNATGKFYFDDFYCGPIKVITATKLQFSVVPSSTWKNQNFTVSVKATNNDNELDVNANQQISLQKTIGNGTLNSVAGLTQQLAGGIYTWTDLTYDSLEYFSVTINENTASLTPATSNMINCLASGQILNETFTDSDFSNNPEWYGETGDFIVTPELQLELFTVSTTYDTSYLVTPIWLQLDSIEWQAYVKLNFDPSSSNYIKYYLVSNNSNVRDTLHGYFIKIGEDGANDAIELFYQNGNTITSICRGTNGLLATSPDCRIKVIRTNMGQWSIYADPTGGSSFELQASGIENSFFNNGFYTGMYCRFSSSYATDKFYFDDFYCGPVQVDTIHPAFVSLSVVDSMHIDLTFNEGISLSSAQDTANYFVNSGIGRPVSAIRDAMDYKIIHLAFSTIFSPATVYTLSANDLFDFSGNEISQPVSQTFIWYKAVPNDIQINEIMADPSPVIGLPDFEYIEIYNRTIYPIDITGWTLTIGSSTVVLPSKKLNPTKYILFSTAAAQVTLQPYGDVLGIISSSSALTNAGTSVILRDKENQVISTIEFSDSWYRNAAKDDGGWSLEQIDPLNPCGEDANWTASTDPSGGTPGRKNSVYTANTDNNSPEILRATIVFHDTLPLTPDTLLITFSETIISDGAINVANYNVDKGIGSPYEALFTDITRKKARLVFNQTFVKDSIYTITLTGEIKDCAGNLITTSNNAQFALADTLSPGCLIINEVLFNPYTGGADYIELYNNTNKIFNLADLRLAVLDNTGQPSELFEIAPEGFYMFPGSYSVMSVDYKLVTQFYSSPGRKVFAEMSDMPSYNNSDGRVSIIDKMFNVIDDFSYSESMQFQLLNSFQGVSLERIHPDYPTQDQKNWHSAAESAGFGTPGYVNSQYAQFDDNNSQITVEPEVFSPDNDGFDDLLNIRYKFDQPGFVANVTIFDARGRKVKRLIVSEMLPTEGYFTWDGLNDYNQKASIGIYVIFIEVFNLDGKTSQFKKTCVLGSHLH